MNLSYSILTYITGSFVFSLVRYHASLTIGILLVRPQICRVNHGSRRIKPPPPKKVIVSLNPTCFLHHSAHSCNNPLKCNEIFFRLFDFWWRHGIGWIGKLFKYVLSWFILWLCWSFWKSLFRTKYFGTMGGPGQCKYNVFQESVQFTFVY